MVSQMNWEADILWNLDDVKQKVLPNLNCKTNAAGWLPSGTNCTTVGNFGQSGKGMVPLAGGSVQLATSNIKVTQSLKTATKSNM